MVKKVAIVGAGPCGVLLAHYLLHRDQPYQIDLYERRNDPRTLSFSNARTFPITLNERGMLALQQIPGLAEAVKAISVEISGTIFHPKSGKPRVTTRDKAFIALDRTNLVIALLNQLPQTEKLNLHFNCACTQIDLAAKTLSFERTTGEVFTTSYDLLIGADGARSIVREQLLNTELFEFQQKYVPRDYKSIFIADATEQSIIDLKAGKIHSWRSQDGTVLLLVPQPGGTLSGLIHFLQSQNPIANLSTPEQILQFFKTQFPELGAIMPLSEAAEFLERPLSRVLTIRCNQYHANDSILILGDAAHAVSPALGQGCNASLEDVFVLHQLLNEFEDDLPQAIAQFTQRRKADAYALAELSDYAFPSSSKLFVEFLIREQVSKRLHQLFPNRFLPSLSQMLFETSASYSEILQAYQGWITKVKRSSEQPLATTKG
jgi:kynurenine 3-monooxygenase